MWGFLTKKCSLVGSSRRHPSNGDTSKCATGQNARLPKFRKNVALFRKNRKKLRKFAAKKEKKEIYLLLTSKIYPLNPPFGGKRLSDHRPKAIGRLRKEKKKLREKEKNSTSRLSDLRSNPSWRIGLHISLNADRPTGSGASMPSMRICSNSPPEMPEGPVRLSNSRWPTIGRGCFH